MSLFGFSDPSFPFPLLFAVGLRCPLLTMAPFHFSVLNLSTLIHPPEFSIPPLDQHRPTQQRQAPGRVRQPKTLLTRVCLLQLVPRLRAAHWTAGGLFHFCRITKELNNVSSQSGVINAQNLREPGQSKLSPPAAALLRFRTESLGESDRHEADNKQQTESTRMTSSPRWPGGQTVQLASPTQCFVQSPRPGGVN